MRTRSRGRNECRMKRGESTPHAILLYVHLDVSADSSLITRPPTLDLDPHLPFIGQPSSATFMSATQPIRFFDNYHPPPNANSGFPYDPHECQGCVSAMQVSRFLPPVFHPNRPDLYTLAERRKW